MTSSKEEKKKYEDEIETLKKEMECLLKRIDGDWDESKNTEENIRPSELIKLRLEKEELERVRIWFFFFKAKILKANGVVYV